MTSPGYDGVVALSSARPAAAVDTTAASSSAAVVAIFKPGIAVFTGATAVLGLLLANPAADAATFAGLGLGMTAAAAGSGAWNHAFEVERDRRVARTATRPCASGAIPVGRALALGAAAMAGGAAVVGGVGGTAAAALTLTGAAWYAVVYTLWLKPRTWWATPVGGLAGSWAVLAGGATGGAVVAPAVLLLAAALATWSPPHFWALALARRQDYARAGVPVLPLVVAPARAARAVFGHAVLTVGLLALLGRTGLGVGFGVAAVAVSLPWLRSTWRLRATPDDATVAMRAFIHSCTGLAAVLALAAAFILGG